MRKESPVRETITYPKVTGTSNFDPCHDKSTPFEHVLSCGHLITTPKSDEPCAPNCQNAATEKDARKVQQMNIKTALKMEFYCDACVELEGEREIPATASCKAAEDHRKGFRKTTAARRNKAHEFRRCYIAQKTVSVPCDEDGHVVKGYDPHPHGHPFDNAWPRSGRNMFEDIEVPPTKNRKSKWKQPFGKARTLTKTMDTADDTADDTATSVDDALAEDDNETVAEGARWLLEQEELARQRQEATPSTRRHRAGARPIVLSSSPETGMSSFVVTSSSPLTTQASPQNTVRNPQVSKKKRDRKRKRTTRDETTTPPAVQPAKRVKATPKTPSASRAAKSTRLTSTAVPSAKKAKATAPPAAAKPSKKQSKRVCTVL